jgi:hypothetical protein
MSIWPALDLLNEVLGVNLITKVLPELEAPTVFSVVVSLTFAAGILSYSIGTGAMSVFSKFDD